MAEVALGPVSQIPPGEGRNFVVDTLEIAVFHTRSGTVFATQAACPHRGGPLADGLTDGQTVVRPLHDRVYALVDGSGLGNDCALRVYPVRVSDGMVYLRGE